ncbi:protein-glutamine gamma-glutamyltransferase 4-like [Sceloporus undulatus]|uniref:protein-glutamine gamma-glutamyltransferase 4-like n=1 Tax=Sceloporus undulatus TaxID=8520 RepID=UPI001C4AB21F|nr:protein-glutamine gamma-glutamyltransferase 4-like [Sceloporus undulatus]
MSKTIGCLLKTIGVDFLRKENTRLHHTDKFKNDSLIVRRGQKFSLKVTFSRELKVNDEIILKLSIGKTPLQSDGTLLSLNTKSERNDQGWHAKIGETNGKECLISVVSPADAIIGKYVLEVITGPNVCDPGKRFFYVLFNPWCEADSVFMPGEDQKTEFVLNDTGSLYRMTSPQRWKYGQFEEDILDCCMYLLDKSQLGPNDKRNPVKITRAMSALVNMEDEKGVLFGKWKFENQNPNGQCDGFPCPWNWKDSVRILKQYYRTKKPVLYGQCWVFSGVLNTVMRCLGIPARSVTTFNAGVDTDKNISIDSPKDSYWNFHVWNDVWMKRPDLPKGYDGWQAVDGTAQVKSEGIYCCGPASLKAIKNGEVNHDYDTMFLFSAVNAETGYWKIKKDNGQDKCEWKENKSFKIGTKIITKAIGNEKPEDIMDEYKFPEGDPSDHIEIRM